MLEDLTHKMEGQPRKRGQLGSRNNKFSNMTLETAPQI